MPSGDRRRNPWCLLVLVGSAFSCLRGLAGPSPAPEVINVDSSSESDMSDMPWAPLEPEPMAQPRVVEADEVTDMPVPRREVTSPLREPPRVQDRVPPRGEQRQQHPGRTSSSSSSSSAFPGVRQHQAPGQVQGWNQAPGQVQGTTQNWGWNPQQQQPPPAQTHSGAALQGGVPQQPQGATDERYATYRIGYAQTYDPAADPWHEDGMFPGRPGQPVQMPYDPWEDDLDQPQQTMQPPLIPYRGYVQNPMQRQQQPYAYGPTQTTPPQNQAPTQQQQLPQQQYNQLGQTSTGTGAPMIPGAGQFQPPTMDPWGIIARQYASQGPLLPPDQWSHNALGLGRYRAQAQPDDASLASTAEPTCAADSSCEETSPGEDRPGDELDEATEEADAGDFPPPEEADDELVDMPDEDLEWDSDQPDTEDEEEEHTQAAADQPGVKAPKRTAGHGSQRVANKAKKSDVKKLWRELNWGPKPKWLSWRAALQYIRRGEPPPAKEPLPPTPSPQREHLRAALAAHHYSYDAQGKLIPHHPPPQATTHPEQQGDKALNQARADHAQRRATNPYMQQPGARPRAKASMTEATSTPGSTTASTAPGRPQPVQPQPQPGQQQLAQAKGEPTRRTTATTQTPQRGTSRQTQPDPQTQPPHQQQQPAQQQASSRQSVSFQLPEDHREDPPRPIRRQHMWRKLTDSTEVQLRGDGVANYPVQIIDNRPIPGQDSGGQPQDTAAQQLHNHLHNVVGDFLVVQPAHITDYPQVPGAAASSRGSRETPMETGGPPLPDISDLEQQANQAIAEGRAPALQRDGEGPSMRSSVRVDDNSHDISWVQGITPATLPPPMPLHPRSVLSMRASTTGSWRGVTWSPPTNSLIRHPARLDVEPTIVLYKTLGSTPDRGVLPDGLQLSLRPAGAWIATTRFELGFARTPRYFPDRMHMSTGASFWLEWRGEEQRWLRRPRFPNDVVALGGFPSIPSTDPPRPPTPPQRRDPTVGQRSSQQQPRGFNPQNFVDTRPLRGRLIQPATTSSSSSSQTRGPSSMPAGTDDNAHDQGRQPMPTAKSKARPPQPPRTTSGSESETSWPSEDPPAEQQEDSMLLEVAPHAADDDIMQENITEELILVQTGRITVATPLDNGEAIPPLVEPGPGPTTTGEAQPANDDAAWFSVAANFEGDFTVHGLLRLLQRILHEMLQQSFTLPSDYLTSLAYHACYYVSKLQSTNDRNAQQETTGGHPECNVASAPTAMVFSITNAFVEAEAALESLAHHREELPQRHLVKELRRADGLLRDGRAVFKSWAKDPRAPGALPGTAASQNALDGVSWSFLAIEEGGMANLDEALQQAWQATQRCNRYMEELLDWIEKQFQEGAKEGSPSPKRRRTETATGSNSRPQFEAAEPGSPPTSCGHASAPGALVEPLPHAVPVPPESRPLHDPGAAHRGGSQPEPGSAPYNVLRAQRLLEEILPFTEQQVAVALQEAHSFLLQWTTGLWGEPIILSDSAGSAHGGTGPPEFDEHSGADLTGGALPPTLPAADSEDETLSVASHRRRRAHAAFGD